MLIEIQTRRTFIPKWRGNRQLPVAEQIVAHYRVIPLKDKARVLPKPAINFEYDAKGNVKGGKTEVGFDRKPVIDAMLIRLDNAYWSDEDGKHEIITAKDLEGAPTDYEGLSEELGDFFREELEKKNDEKN